MMFLNLGDGYSSGCCTNTLYHYAHEDPVHAIGALYVEHPDNRPGSFVNQIAEPYKARTITFAKHRSTVDELIENKDAIIETIKAYGDQFVVFIGISDLYSFVGSKEQLEELAKCPAPSDIEMLEDIYLQLDGFDEFTSSPALEKFYLELCNNKTSQNINLKISQLQSLIGEISNIVDKVVVYRTTAQPFNLNVPSNCIYLEESILDMLKDFKPHRRGYFDKIAYRSLKSKFLKIL